MKVYCLALRTSQIRSGNVETLQRLSLPDFGS